MNWCGVAGVVSSALVDGHDVVCYERVRVWLACAWHEVGKVVVDGFSADPAVAPEAAYVLPHAVLHCSVALDHFGLAMV